MKTIISLTLLFALVLQLANAQEERPIYTVAYNHAPDGFNYPLIGFVNHAVGDHKGAQIGFVNTNGGDFSGAQISFLNTTGGDLDGAQISFVNVTAGGYSGSQIGFINTAVKESSGAQIGFVNTLVKESSGTQIGFVNTAAQYLGGAQIGFVNINPAKVDGAQIGFVNMTKSLESLQLGFLNYADSLKDNGVPIGLLSIVRKGGYKAIEFGFTEMHPVNASFKIGVPKLYTTFNASYNPDLKDEFALGGGFGSILAMGNVFYVNPEAIFQNQVGSNNDMVRLSLNLGIALSQKIHLVVGPSATWVQSDKYNEYVEPNFYFRRDTFDENDELFLGINAALRYNFSY
ncbi:hypothetical protein IFO69_09850 [Echinicola sp. CAU 1574]|uniref:Uncharacterized protein n=1 Tax=Echinicola arenosa TaxID=2774144 RepID=A0ABR9AMG7_9BACT|nr:hypothetical protein [Echinicola arenosa]MBD8489048.1 hypothetical protein [Echinicola arenosa]